MQKARKGAGRFRVFRFFRVFRVPNPHAPNLSLHTSLSQCIEEVDQNLIRHCIGQGVEHLVDQRHLLHQLPRLQAHR